MGEALSEFMREVRPDDLRNRNKGPELLEELADTAIMLITAMGEGAVYSEHWFPDYLRPMSDARLLDFAGLQIAHAKSYVMEGGEGKLNITLALDAIEYLVRRRNKDLEEAVIWKLAKIEGRISSRGSIYDLYLRGGGTFCPYCHSDGVEFVETQPRKGAVYVISRCHICKSEWAGVYRLEDLDLTYAQDPLQTV